MSRFHLALAFVALIGAGRIAVASDDHVFYHENVMGTSLELRVLTESEPAARWAEARVLAEIDRLSKVFSGYDPSSEFSRWMATSGVPTRVSPELFDLLRLSDEWRSRSGGAFDPRVEALSRLWSRCAKLDRTPTDAERQETLALMGRPAWKLDPAARTAERTSICPISLNGIAKGYIVGVAADAAMDKGRGILGLLLNVGGDMRILGEAPRMVGIVAPRSDSETSAPLTTIAVTRRSIATSGNSQRGWRIAGKWYSHIFDPKSGRPVETVVEASVISEDATTADALAKVLNVRPVEEGLKIARSIPGVECLLVTEDGREWPSDGWETFESPRPLRLAANALMAQSPKTKAKTAKKEENKTEAKPAWNDEYELLVKFEIGNPGGANQKRYRRPYVAVWVEDKDGLAVRTLSLWLQTQNPGPRWHRDLKKWYQTDQTRKKSDDTNLIKTVARPTRPPGQYDVIWDGKDDNGKSVEAGEYTLHIEAAREHGTYQIIRKPLTIADKPFTEELKGNEEIKSASVELRRKDAKK
jgi:thiamine biosynthesis lipoprotein ApbE